MIFQISDMRLTARLASAAAAAVITGMMLVCLGLGFATPAAAEPGLHLSAGASVVGRFE